MLNVVNEYIEIYKKEVLKTIEAFGYTVNLEKIKKIETMAQNRKNKIMNDFNNGVDVSRGLISHIIKPIDIIKKENKFYYVVIVNKKRFLFDLNDLFRWINLKNIEKEKRKNVSIKKRNGNTWVWRRV